MEFEGGLNDLAICSLCSGYGGLELGIKRVFPRTKTVCYVEGEAFAVQHLIKKMEEGRLDHAPIWSNLITFDGSKWRGKVDLITGGFPCQPFSYAGSQKGTEDERHLWPHVSRIISEIRPKYIFLENVPGVIKWILPDILGELSKMGYDASWCVIRASDAGAPHRRARWFLWASNTNGFKWSTNERKPNTKTNRRNNIEGLGENVSNSHIERWNENKFESQKGKQSHVIGSCENLSNTNSSREQGSKCKILNDQEKRGKENAGKFNQKDFIRGKFTDHWEIEPSMGRLVDGASDWVDKLRILGNGVVPQQAEYALRLLLKNLDSSKS
jgi:DNA (cytosine-5)-methyltransferase 1